MEDILLLLYVNCNNLWCSIIYFTALVFPTQESKCVLNSIPFVLQLVKQVSQMDQMRTRTLEKAFRLLDKHVSNF